MTIEPISELKNYNTLLTEVKDGSPIYLTKNGKGVYAIMTINDANDYERYQINKEFEKGIRPDVTKEDFFVKDIETLNKKLAEAMEEAEKEEKNGVEDNEDISVFFDKLRKKIDDGIL